MGRNFPLSRANFFELHVDATAIESIFLAARNGPIEDIIPSKTSAFLLGGMFEVPPVFINDMFTVTGQGPKLKTQFYEGAHAWSIRATSQGELARQDLFLHYLNNDPIGKSNVHVHAINDEIGITDRIIYSARYPGASGINGRAFCPPLSLAYSYPLLKAEFYKRPAWVEDLPESFKNKSLGNNRCIFPTMGPYSIRKQTKKNMRELNAAEGGYKGQQTRDPKGIVAPQKKTHEEYWPHYTGCHSNRDEAFRIDAHTAQVIDLWLRMHRRNTSLQEAQALSKMLDIRGLLGLVRHRKKTIIEECRRRIEIQIENGCTSSHEIVSLVEEHTLRVPDIATILLWLHVPERLTPPESDEEG
jgi:hypothetical protein